jgi:hypothetical protein
MAGIAVVKGGGHSLIVSSCIQKRSAVCSSRVKHRKECLSIFTVR